MKPLQLYQGLRELADRLDVQVTEQNFRHTGIKVKSGLCKVRGATVFVMDKHKSLNRKIALLAECLSRMPRDDVYILPVIRDLLKKHQPVHLTMGATPTQGTDHRDRNPSGSK